MLLKQEVEASASSLQNCAPINTNVKSLKNSDLANIQMHLHEGDDCIYESWGLKPTALSSFVSVSVFWKGSGQKHNKSFLISTSTRLVFISAAGKFYKGHFFRTGYSR